MDVEAPVLERLLRRDRQIVIGGLVFVGLASWLYILLGAGMETREMAAMPGGGATAMTPAMTPTMTPVWTPGYFALMLAMWWVMMVAMMLPSAAPLVLLFAAVNRKSRLGGRPYVPTGVFAAGYLVAWGGFSLLAVLGQWGLERLALLSPMMQTTSLYLGAALLVGAGVYQLTPLKQACLRHCRSPLAFIAHHWRQGSGGAFRMGLEHGLFCLGCCWVLMALLFYGGVMNLWWVAGLALYVLIEKLAPGGPRLGRHTGGLLILWGLWVLAGTAGEGG
jgi:predicted metal-binding membrane protein